MRSSIDRLRGRAVPAANGDPLKPEGSGDDNVSIDLEQLYRGGAAPLVDQLSRDAGGRDNARDIVHEAFARYLSRGLAVRQDVMRPDAYLARISRNLLADRSRSSAVQREWFEDRIASAIDHHDGVVFLESRDRLRRFEAAIMKLKPKTRQVFLARRIDGLSYAEIADLTGLSIKGVEKQMSKAIAKLGRLLDRD